MPGDGVEPPTPAFSGRSLESRMLILLGFTLNRTVPAGAFRGVREGFCAQATRNDLKLRPLDYVVAHTWVCLLRVFVFKVVYETTALIKRN